MADYELWMTDDLGRRFALLSDMTEPFFLSYSRAVSGLGTLSFGCAFESFQKKIKPYFLPDRRIEVWRSAANGYPMRREDVYMLRKPHIYTREDNVQVIQLYGNNGVDLLKRRSVVQRNGTSYTNKTDNIDDMMKEFVRQQMLYGSALDEDGVVDNTRAWPQNEFTVQGDLGLGPSVTRGYADRVVFDLLKDLKALSYQLNVESSASRRIHFDVVPKDLASGAAASGAVLGWEFQTFADLRGTDRTTSREFSPENENIKSPAYSVSHLDEVNSVFVRGNGQGANQIVTNVEDSVRVASSRWNRFEKVISASSESSTTALQNAGKAELNKGKPSQDLLVTLLNTPGSRNVPRSLYGVDWDLGDRLPISYAGLQFEAEVNIVYVSVDQDGKEEITGRNEIQTI
jgi:hypothetical protein